MQVGSLVVCVNSNGTHDKVFPLVLSKIYTIREVIKDEHCEGVLLEEIINGMYADNEEFGYRADRFRELDTPVSINIEELIYEKV